jgi:predicted mannosyl-3-phosphoglycerate phosphatase (HAD superfamily)
MRKMLMRICLGLASPGGPCALEVKTATGDIATWATLEEWSGIPRSTERLAASVSLSETALGVVRECTAQWEQGPIG